MILSRKYYTKQPGRSYDKIFSSIFSVKQSSPDLIPSFISKDQCLTDKPIIQDVLTEKGKTLNKPLEYANYHKKEFGQISFQNIHDSFEGGILNYIHKNSEELLNTSEIDFHYACGKNRMDYSTKNDLNYNILNIFDYENACSDFYVFGVEDAFFGFTLKRIKVKPLYYSIRSGRISRLISFNFEGYDEKAQKWDLLDERVNMINLQNSGSYLSFYVHTTNKNYSSFQVRQTEPGFDGFWGFSIAGIDIHGDFSLN